ncbi:MAG: hypothetical protein FWC16_02335 [Defluviitaleaceae bacterium]|nr:hypothetical protein [Defluviitaleaceae bacterium]MCL2273736.1 hypothetical protein [Defluviitaleaceae bacterium]
MTKLELMTVMYSLETLIESEKPEKALGVIKRIIAEAEKRPQDKNEDNKN